MSHTLSNAEIADRLSTLAQLLASEKANPYKIRAYRRAASTIRVLGQSVDELVSKTEQMLFEINSSPDRLDLSAENARLPRPQEF
jgi:DNA polymerase/3'-5' exonuclease PolX